jgi:hypothetical protein
MGDEITYDLVYVLTLLSSLPPLSGESTCMTLLSLYVQCRTAGGWTDPFVQAAEQNSFFVAAGWPDACFTLNRSRYGRHRGAGEMKAGGAGGN